jgi:hypothetical protein
VRQSNRSTIHYNPYSVSVIGAKSRLAVSAGRVHRKPSLHCRVQRLVIDESVPDKHIKNVMFEQSADSVAFFGYSLGFFAIRDSNISVDMFLERPVSPRGPVIDCPAGRRSPAGPRRTLPSESSIPYETRPRQDNFKLFQRQLELQRFRNQRRFAVLDDQSPCGP